MPTARRITGSALLLALAFLLGMAIPADACTTGQPPDITELVPGQPIDQYHSQEVVVGFFEFEFVARSPGLIVIGPRSVNIVTRYWGEPPSHLGPELSGSDLGILGGDNCGQRVGHPGEVGYWWVTDKTVDQTGWNRSTYSVEGIAGALTPDQEAMLTDRFGPPVDLGVSLSDRTVGFIMAWQWQMLTLVVIGAVAVGIVRLVRRRRGTATESSIS